MPSLPPEKIYETFLSVLHKLLSPLKNTLINFKYCHEKLSQSCIEAAKAMQIRYHLGTIASQDLFMSRDEDFEKLMNHFPDSICSEMEAGAIGAVATQFNIPFVIVRSLSDVVHHNENPMEFSTYVSKASAQSAKLIENWLMRI